MVITVPSTGVPQNQSSGIFGMLAAQVYIVNANVNLSNLTVDGGGGTTCSVNVHQVGVLFSSGGRQHDELFGGGCTAVRGADFGVSRPDFELQIHEQLPERVLRGLPGGGLRHEHHRDE